MSYDHWKTRSLDDDYGEPPLVQVECSACDGAGHIVKGMRVYEAGCGFSHMDSYEDPCSNCHGQGFFLCEAEGNR